MQTTNPITETTQYTYRDARVVLLEPLNGDADVSSLAAYGSVELMFDKGPTRDAPSVFNTPAFVAAVARWAEESGFDPARDHFVVSGRLTKVAIATFALARAFPTTPVRVLLYDGATGKYVRRTLE